MASDSTQRFTSRVDDYVRYRPDYPSKLFELMERECGLTPGAAVVDLGSGTGISTRRLLSSGAQVTGVEPNAAMREAAMADLSGEPRFRSAKGTAERTGLPAGTIDLITAFQAFHWFDRSAAHREFVRILKPGGQVALVWNERSEEATPFLRGYEALLRQFSDDYLAVRHNAIREDDLQAWFGGTMRMETFANQQRFDYRGVLGRLRSSSYAPSEDDPRHVPMTVALRRLFDETSEDGEIDFVYETKLFYGPLG